MLPFYKKIVTISCAKCKRVKEINKNYCLLKSYGFDGIYTGLKNFTKDIIVLLNKLILWHETLEDFHLRFYEGT